MNNEEEIVDLEGLSTIKVSTDSSIKNQDARSMEVKPGQKDDFKRNGDLFLGNKGIQLENGEYVNETELISAIENALNKSTTKKTEVIISGKKIDSANMEAIKKAIKSCSGIVVEKARSKRNVDTRTVSVEQKDGSKSVQGGLFLGKDTTTLSDGEYKNVGEVRILKQERAVIPSTPTKVEVVKKKKMPTWVKGVGLSIGASILVPVVLQSIFMANSISWHHAPEAVQSVLHAINTGLGSLIADFTKTSGEWITNKGNILNENAVNAQMFEAYARYGLAAVSSTALGAQIKQFVSMLKKDKQNEELEQGRVK